MSDGSISDSTLLPDGTKRGGVLGYLCNTLAASGSSSGGNSPSGVPITA